MRTAERVRSPKPIQEQNTPQLSIIYGINIDNVSTVVITLIKPPYITTVGVKNTSV